MVEVKCDQCGALIGDVHVEVFRYVRRDDADDDDEDDIREIGLDFCGDACHLTNTLNTAIPIETE
jgi:DNA-directed RNA polymerase subunit N (RpoN/RPB10)